MPLAPPLDSRFYENNILILARPGVRAQYLHPLALVLSHDGERKASAPLKFRLLSSGFEL